PEPKAGLPTPIPRGVIGRSPRRRRRRGDAVAGEARTAFVLPTRNRADERCHWNSPGGSKGRHHTKVASSEGLTVGPSARQPKVVAEETDRGPRGCAAEQRSMAEVERRSPDQRGTSYYRC